MAGQSDANENRVATVATTPGKRVTAIIGVNPAAVLQALAKLGGPEAAAAIPRIIEGDIVQDPGLI